jgi:hypothetical protein
VNTQQLRLGSVSHIVLKDLRPQGGFVSYKVKKGAIGGVFPFCSPSSSLQAISLLIDPTWEQGMRRNWELGGILPVGEALWQEGICGHRVYLTSLL